MQNRKRNIFRVIFNIDRYLTPIAFIVGIIYFFNASPKHNLLYLTPAVAGFVTSIFAAAFSTGKRSRVGFKSIPANLETSAPTSSGVEPSAETTGRKRIKIFVNSPVKCPNCKSLDKANTYGGRYYCQACNVPNPSPDVLKQWDWLERELNRIRESQIGFNR